MCFDRFLVIANGIASAYSFAQVVRCVVGLIRGSVLFNKYLAWAIFSGDQVVISPSGLFHFILSF